MALASNNTALNRSEPATPEISGPQAHTHFLVSDQELSLNVCTQDAMIGQLLRHVNSPGVRGLISSSEFRVLLSLGSVILPRNRTAEGHPFVEIEVKDLESLANLGRSAVYAATRALQDKGLIIEIERGGGRRATRFAIVWPDGESLPVRNSGLSGAQSGIPDGRRAPDRMAGARCGARHPSGIPDEVLYEHASAPARAEAEEVKKLASAARWDEERQMRELLKARGIFPAGADKLLKLCPWLSIDFIQRTDAHRVALEAAGQKIKSPGGWYYTAIAERYVDQQPHQLPLFTPREPDRHEIRRRREREEHQRIESEQRAANAFVESLSPDQSQRLLAAAIAAADASHQEFWSRRGIKDQGVRLKMHALAQNESYPAAAGADGALQPLEQGGL